MRRDQRVRHPRHGLGTVRGTAALSGAVLVEYDHRPGWIRCARAGVLESVKGVSCSFGTDRSHRKVTVDGLVELVLPWSRRELDAERARRIKCRRLTWAYRWEPYAVLVAIYETTAGRLGGEPGEYRVVCDVHQYEHMTTGLAAALAAAADPAAWCRGCKAAWEREII